MILSKDHSVFARRSETNQSICDGWEIGLRDGSLVGSQRETGKPWDPWIYHVMRVPSHFPPIPPQQQQLESGSELACFWMYHNCLQGFLFFVPWTFNFSWAFSSVWGLSAIHLLSYTSLVSLCPVLFLLSLLPVTPCHSSPPGYPLVSNRNVWYHQQVQMTRSRGRYRKEWEFRAGLRWFSWKSHSDLLNTEGWNYF